MPGDQYVQDFLDHPNQEPSDLERTRQAFAGPNRADAERFFSQKPEDLARMFGGKAYADGGAMHTDGPLLMMEPQADGTFVMRGVAGEAGREKIQITPEERRFGRGAKGRSATRAGARMFGTGGMVIAGGQFQQAMAANRASAARTAASDQAHANALRDYRGPVEADGSFVINGTRYAGNSGRLLGGQGMGAGQMATIYGNSARMNRYGADPLGTNTRGGVTTVHGGSMLTPEDQAYYRARGDYGGAGAASAGAVATQPRGMQLTGPGDIQTQSPVSYDVAGDTPLMRANRLFGHSFDTTGRGATEQAFIDAALRGETPGLGVLTPQAYGTWDQRRQKAYQALLLGTGQISDPQEFLDLLDRQRPASIGGGYRTMSSIF
jgi:hypothetical protein